MKYILTLDIGGTNPRMAMVEILDSGFDVKKKKDIDKSLDSVISPINEFLGECANENMTTSVCCASVAGPVENNACYQPTNAKFPIIGDEIIEGTLLENVLVINDFAAIGEAIASFDVEKELDSKKLVCVRDRPISETENRAVIGPGSGLGVAYLINSGDNFIVSASEGGHSGFSNRKYLGGLFDFIREKRNLKNQIGTEAFVSGQGIRHIIEYFLKNDEKFVEFLLNDVEYEKVVNEIKDKRNLQEETDNQLMKAFDDEENGQEVDLVAMVSQMKDVNFKARVTMRLFMEFLGMACADLALHGKALGGVFIAGGILTKNKDLLDSEEFERGFADNWKENIEKMLNQVPVFFVDDYDISFTGCARAGKNKFL